MVEPLVLYPVLWLMFCHGGWCYCHLVAKIYKIADVIAMVAVVIATFFFVADVTTTVADVIQPLRLQFATTVAATIIKWQ